MMRPGDCRRKDKHVAKHDSGEFLDLAGRLCDPAAARYAVLPVPYEGTVSYEAGTVAGAAAVIAASRQVEHYDTELGREFPGPGVATYPPVPPAEAPAEMMRRVAAAARPIVEAGRFLLAVGGEHSITAPLVQVCRDVHGPLSVLQIDAHADLRNTYGGTAHSHACVMRRVAEVAEGLCQVGVRAYSQEELDACPQLVANFITPEIIRSDPRWIDHALERLGERVYVTIDMDGLDPSIAPGVGTPEPDGLTWQDATALLRRVCTRRRVVAADVVEVRPIPPNHVTEFLAARLACKILAYTQM